MPSYGYIRTSRDQEPGHPGSNIGQIYADVAASGTKTVSSRNQWYLL